MLSAFGGIKGLARKLSFARCFATVNRVLLSQMVAIEPKKSWQILYNLPAEARSAEAINAEHTIWLRTLNEIRTFFRENPNAEF